MEETKFCKYCGEKIPFDAVVCTKCGRQVEKLGGDKEGIVINNVASSASSASSSASSSSSAPARGRTKLVNKWVSFMLCLLLGWLGVHKFYEGKGGLGVLYVLTFGIFGIGWIIDIFVILGKPDPYEVYLA